MNIPHINLSETTRVRLPLVMLLTLMGFIAAAAVVWSGDRGVLYEQQQKLIGHDTRIKTLEDGQVKISVMQNDVEWIRKSIERQENNPR